MNKVRLVLLAIMVSTLPFILGGCLFGSSGGNPVGPQAGAQLQPATSNADVGTIDPKILAAKFQTPNSGSGKTYTFAKGDCKTSKKFKANQEKFQKMLRIILKKDSNANNIFITLKDMEVNPISGKTLTFPLPSQEINLRSGDDLNDIFSDVPLPVGMYRSFSFNITSARYVKDGKSTDLYLPLNKVMYMGKFEIREGFITQLSIKFVFTMSKFRDYFKHKFDKQKENERNHREDNDDKELKEKDKKHTYVWMPVVMVKSSLVAAPPAPAPNPMGTIDGTVADFVTKSPLAGISVAVQGTSFTTTTDSLGKFSVASVPAGTYNVVFTNPNFLDMSVSQLVENNAVHTLNVQLNPKIIKSTMANTGWFSAAFPLADANGKFGEVAMESPVVIDFTSLAFVKAEVAFDAEYFDSSGGGFNSYLSITKQVQVLQDLGTWWVGNNATLGTLLGQFASTSPASHYTVDVTNFVKTNPNAAYFLASKNLSMANMRMQNIQLTISY